MKAQLKILPVSMVMRLKYELFPLKYHSVSMGMQLNCELFPLDIYGDGALRHPEASCAMRHAPPDQNLGRYTILCFIYVV